MAERRMFTKKVTDDDNFLSLSSSAQALYLHLSMAADDDGFCNQVSVSMFKAHASVQDLEALLDKRFLYQFENGVIVIKHWRMANALRKDRYTPTAFQEELAMLELKDNESYTLATNWQPTGNQLAPQDRLGKDSIGKDRLVQDRLGEDKEKTDTNVSAKKKFTPPTVEEVEAYCQEMGYGIDPDAFVDYYEARGWMAGKTHMKDWKAACRTWERRRREESKSKKPSGDDFMERLMNA